MSKKRKKNIVRIKKFFYFLILIFFISSSIFAYNNYKKSQRKFLIKDLELKVKENLKNKKDFSEIKKFLDQEEKKKIAKKLEYDRLAKIAFEKKKEAAAKSKNKTLIVSTSARGKKSFGYFYAFGDGFMFRKGKISSGIKNFETPIGFFNLKYKEKEKMSNLYPDESGRNNMNNMIAITKSGIALHEGNPNLPSHGCVHIPKSHSLWLYNWVDKNTKIYITNLSKIDYKHKSLSKLISEIKKYNTEEEKRNSIKKEKIVKWDNGNIKEKWTWKGGRLEGPQYFYYRNGKLREIKTYYHDRLNGVQKTYYSNGVNASYVYIAGGKVWEKMIWAPSGEMLTYYQRPLPNKKK